MKKYFFSADVVRNIAIFGVIGVHLVIPVTARPDFFGGSLWWLTFLLNCLFRVSVPLFIMLSGYLSLGKTVSVRQNFQRISQRLLVPLFFYYFLFNIVYATMAYLRAEPFDYWGIFHNLSKNTHSSLYFLVILAMIQLLNPLWNLLTEQKNLPVLRYVTSFFLGLGAIAYVFYYVSLREGEVFSTFTLWMMWVGYYLYGYVVKIKEKTLSQPEIRLFLLGSFVSYLATVGFGYITLYLYHGGMNDLFYIGGQTYADAYLSISVIVMSICIFNLLMRSQWIEHLSVHAWLKRLTVFMAGLTFALYLNHLLVMDTLSKFFGVTPDSPSMPGLAGYLVINTFLTFFITVPLAFLIKNTPILRKVVGEK